MRKLKGKAVIEAIWDVKIPEDSQRRDADEIRKAAKGIVKEALMDEAMATKVFVKSLEMNITEEDDAEHKED